MSNLTFYTDKKNNFKYKLSVEGDGANLANTTSRLCLEFKNGLNIYIKSKINEQTGQCIANFPLLDFIGETSGQLKIETIANKTHFQLYESPFSLKQSVKVNVEIGNDNNNLEEEEENNINFGIQIDTSNFKEEKIVEEVTKPKKVKKKKVKKTKKDIIQDVNDFSNYKPIKESSNKELKSFSEWLDIKND